ncbi:ORF6N domain-containing protein [Yersinia enterocolitica]|uniref:ORF6N domain-containing protein n=1 Tax=Yersinia enterocolitica TaxID=630 RepID=UPI0005E90F29|nr:ORF6N domain-containing protein [Yersinia enterocolitica]EKN6388655.1 ORF6N domain-containing protein [Yersinia enterocolitica]ELW8961364.1 ORF6N domain-containing protein [Yersinia enterocolitica]CNH64423.1 Phage anti-repressor protein [Yersinia enterocolitica]HEI6714823.1 ORF6N domain-containing protein [Yersinia enterocolitica]HEN3512835.1 ORF6N domain-containing protein [Yersinia enterocolitica]
MKSIDTLKPILHNQIPVITTELLAQLYGTDVSNIKMNHSRNQTRFEDGKHYFKLVGDELRTFKHKVTESYLVATRAKHLILWTERGAARHAKMLETDQAWEVFEKLEDCYFSQNREHYSPSPQQIPNRLSYSFLTTVREGKVVSVRMPREDECFLSFETFKECAEKAGYLVIHSEDMMKMTLDQFLKLSRNNKNQPTLK